MELRQLRYFAAIAASGSFSKAAEVVYVAQSALSHQLAQLERELGTRLLHRMARGVTLTEAGRVFLPHAQAILRQADDARASVAGPLGRPTGKVTFGLPPSTCNVFALPLLQAVHRDLPGVELELTEELTGSLATLLRQGAVDLAILIDDGEIGQFTRHPLLTERLHLVSKTGVAGKPGARSISFKRALALPLLLPAPKQGVRPLIENAARRHGYPPPNVMAEINSVSILRSTLLAGIGHTVLSPAAFRQELDAGLLSSLPIRMPSLSRDLVVCSSNQVPMSMAASAVLELTLVLAHELVRSGAWLEATVSDGGGG